MGVHMDGTDIHVKEKMEVGAGERQAANPGSASIVENWRIVLECTNTHTSLAFRICCNPLFPSPPIPVTV